MNWEYVTLDKLGHVSRGRSKHRPRNDKVLFGGKYPFVQTADVKSAELYLTEYTETYNERGLEQSKLWKAGTLCITIAANIADTAILGVDACFPDSVMGFVPFEGVSNVKFVKYAFDILQRDCQKISQGTAQDNLSWKKLSTIKFPAPPIAVQDKIVSILSVYDDLIENGKKQLRLLDEVIQRCYKEWFIYFRFPGYENTEIVNGVPKEWRKMKIVDLCNRINAGGTPSRGKAIYYAKEGYRWFKTKELLDGWLLDSEEHISEEGLEGSSAKLFPQDTIVMAIYASPTLGRLGIMRESACTNQAALCMEVNSAICSWQWFYMKLFELRETFNAIARGAGQQNISGDVVKNTVVIVPDEKIMDTFTDFIAPYFEKKYVLAKQIFEAQQARERLLPKLLNGEIEV